MDLRKPLGSLSAFHCMLLTDIDEEVTGMTARLVLVSVGNPPPAEFLRPHPRLCSHRRWLRPAPILSPIQLQVYHWSSSIPDTLDASTRSHLHLAPYLLSCSRLYPHPLPHCRAYSPFMYLSTSTLYIFSPSSSYLSPSLLSLDVSLSRRCILSLMSLPPSSPHIPPLYLSNRPLYGFPSVFSLRFRCSGAPSVFSQTFYLLTACMLRLWW